MPKAIPIRGRRANKRYKNKPEDLFAEMAREMGWSLTKRGWPDFFCVNQRGEPCVVEVKPKSLRPTHDQYRVMLALHRAGIKCYMSDGKKLERFMPRKHPPRYRKRWR